MKDDRNLESYIDDSRASRQQSKCHLHPSDEEWLKWLTDIQAYRFDLFKVDITFNSSGSCSFESRWLQYYQEHIIYKIRKVIGFRYLIVGDIREYEFDVHSRAYRGIDWRCPHHIHAIIGVPKERSHRMLSDRMKRDLRSAAKVSSVHIVAIPTNSDDPKQCLRRAFDYMRKRKTYRPLR